MNKLLYIILVTVSVLCLTSCEQDVDILETETITEVTEMNLKINGRSVITSTAKGSYCDDFMDEDIDLAVGITNVGFYISEIDEALNSDLEVGQYLLQHNKYLEGGIEIFIELLIARVDLDDGNGPVYVVSELENGTNITFETLNESKITGRYFGTVYVLSEDDTFSEENRVGDFELDFSTTDIEICPE